MAPLRVVFMGTPLFAVPSLEILLNHPQIYQVVGVFTQPDKPQGRGQKSTSPPVKACAEKAGVPVWQPLSLRNPEAQAHVQGCTPDVVVVAAYGKILPPAVLAVPRYGCINVHASLLPRHRGASPIAHAILHGDTHTGVAIMHMEEGLDTGPVYSTTTVPIHKEDTTLSLTHTLAHAGALLLANTLPNIASGQLTPVPQPSEGATYAPLLRKQDGALCFDKTALQLEKHINAMNPWPTAFCFYRDQRIQILHAEVFSTSSEPSTLPQGHIAGKTSRGVLVACPHNSLLELLTVKPAGKQQMSALDWYNGYHVKPGDILH
jgi:methionyl-tRNA formyltransferase